VLHVVTMLWDADNGTPPNSRCFDESWVEKLHGNFRRRLTREFKFICFTDRWRRLDTDIEQRSMLLRSRGGPGWGRLLEPFRLDVPMILADLDTVIVGNIDDMADYCLTEAMIAVPRNPYKPEMSIAGFVLAPAGHKHIYEDWVSAPDFAGNNMDWLQRYPRRILDDIWPGAVLSLKAADIRRRGLQGARVVYFHGSPKPSELMHLDWVASNWRV
jgi:hypothetical protein